MEPIYVLKDIAGHIWGVFTKERRALGLQEQLKRDGIQSEVVPIILNVVPQPYE